MMNRVLNSVIVDSTASAAWTSKINTFTKEYPEYTSNNVLKYFERFMITVLIGPTTYEYSRSSAR